MNNVFYTSYLMGGLGNQMFQISKAYSEGLKNQLPVYFRKDSYTPMQGRNTINYVDNIYKKLSFKDNLSPEIRISEPYWSFNKLPSPKNKSVEFFGYFQSSKNFEGYEKNIINIFEPNEEFVEYAINKYPQIQMDDTLSIHIRRGDSFLNMDIHPIANEKYVNKALKFIDNISHVFVFTDDKEWSKQNLKFNNVTFVDESEDYKELWLMSLCKNNIIPNSTFSWWASFLNKNENKIVVAPSIWFGPRGPKHYQDIYEKNWKIVNVEYKNGWLE